MKTVLTTIALTAASLFAVAEASVVGQPAPAFTLTDSNGKSHNLADFKGKTVVLEWTNHDCPFVKKHYGANNMQTQQAEATSKEVVWLTINSSAPGKQGHVDGAAANEVRSKVGAKQTAYLLDPKGDTGRAYGAKTTPHMYIIDANGVLRYNGAIDSISSADQADIPKATQYVSQGLAELSAGKNLSVTTSKPYGCAVKY
ncbi:redoxin domain-containing protein [Permianibacter aggregans]|uniref:Peroxiredoxin n=1 Tax=Permianibacter aggregans TaxID=1510150 RepID=A0A4R6U7J0_9GAMM|nr:redoxin domain-containing protein [Permianibacter aggregans]QGX39846.1 redoxin domain-containing protein [Permianibacter aggregans]TDQ41746.1 peroxiredoxin [Permianibacter aggregans]